MGVAWSRHSTCGLGLRHSKINKLVYNKILSCLCLPPGIMCMSVMPLKHYVHSYPPLSPYFDGTCIFHQFQIGLCSQKVSVWQLCPSNTMYIATVLSPLISMEHVYFTNCKQGYVLRKFQCGLTSMDWCCDLWNVKINDILTIYISCGHEMENKTEHTLHKPCKIFWSNCY